MSPVFRHNRDFRYKTNFAPFPTIPVGTIASIIFVAILSGTVSTVSAQSIFGVQRPTNGYRGTTPNSVLVPQQNPAQASTSTYPSQPTQHLAAYPPAVSAAPAGKVASPALLNNMFSRRDQAEEASPPPIPSVVRLIAFEKNGQSFGSGSYIGSYNEYGLIISNWHVINDCDGLVHVHFPNGFSTYGAVIDSDKKWDLATIVISKPPTAIAPMQIAQTIPVPGEPLWIAGHGPGVYRLAGGRCVRYLAPEIPQNGTNPIYEIVELSVSARQGDSGGPILNQKGELAGVLFGSDMIRNTAGSYCGRVSRFLLRATSILGNLPSQPEVFFASIEKEGPKRQLRDTVRIVPADAIASVAAPAAVDIAGSSVSSFGVRSNSRRYLQNTQTANSPTPNTSISVSPQSSPPVAPASVPTTGKQGSSTPSVPADSSTQSPIQKAVWTKPHRDVYGSISAILPSEQFEQFVQQTGLNTAIQSSNASSSREQIIQDPPDIPSDPFSVDLSSLNPHDATHSSAVLNDRLKPSDSQTKYAAVHPTPYSLYPPQKNPRAASPILLLGGSIFVLLLVFQAFRLIRGDNEPEDIEDESAVSLPLKRNAA